MMTNVFQTKSESLIATCITMLYDKDNCESITEEENRIMADTEVKRSFVVPAERNSRIPFQSVPIAEA